MPTDRETVINEHTVIENSVTTGKLLEEQRTQASQYQQKLVEYESDPVFSSELSEYQKLDPDLTAKKVEEQDETEDKVFYLTFDRSLKRL